MDTWAKEMIQVLDEIKLDRERFHYIVQNSMQLKTYQLSILYFQIVVDCSN
jgi:hypothetical protein